MRTKPPKRGSPRPWWSLLNATMRPLGPRRRKPPQTRCPAESPPSGSSRSGSGARGGLLRRPVHSDPLAWTSAHCDRRRQAACRASLTRRRPHGGREGTPGRRGRGTRQLSSRRFHTFGRLASAMDGSRQAAGNLPKVGNLREEFCQGEAEPVPGGFPASRGLLHSSFAIRHSSLAIVPTPGLALPSAACRA